MEFPQLSYEAHKLVRRTKLDFLRLLKLCDLIRQGNSCHAYGYRNF